MRGRGDSVARGSRLSPVRDLRAARRRDSPPRARLTPSPRTWTSWWTGRHGGRADARGAVPRRPQLGLRRRLPVRAAERLRRAGRPEAAGRRLPRARARAWSSTWSTTTSGRRGTTSASSARTSPIATSTPWGDALNFDGPGQRRGPAVLHRQRALLAHRVPRRRPAAGRHPRASTTASARPFLRGDRRCRPRRGGAPGPRRPVDRRERLQRPARHPPERASAARPGRAVERRLPPRPARAASPASGAATTGTSGASGDMRKAITAGFVYDGQLLAAPRAPARRPADGRSPAIGSSSFIQNHDQVGERATGRAAGAAGRRSSGRSSPPARCCSRPSLPLLFMGEEYAETAPFQYFTSHGDPALAEAVRRVGRKSSPPSPGRVSVPDPHDEETFPQYRSCATGFGDGAHQVLEAYLHVICIRAPRKPPPAGGCRTRTRPRPMPQRSRCSLRPTLGATAAKVRGVQFRSAAGDAEPCRLGHGRSGRMRWISAANVARGGPRQSNPRAALNRACAAPDSPASVRSSAPGSHNGAPMERYICIHGHFYQPPRENAVARSSRAAGSAYPVPRLERTDHRRMLRAERASRILDSENRSRIVNNYARMSFNFGPTLLAGWRTRRRTLPRHPGGRPRQRTAFARARLGDGPGVQPHDSALATRATSAHRSLWGIAGL